MEKKTDRETRYFIDLDLKTRAILNWDCAQRHDLVGQELASPFYHRIYLTRGQFHKLQKKNLELFS